jgi:hypothetical protein
MSTCVALVLACLKQFLGALLLDLLGKLLVGPYVQER